MLVSIKFNNAYVFNYEQCFSLEADMRFKKLESNVIINKKVNVLKSACIYGPNNSGKTCIIRILSALQNIILNKPFSLSNNLFSNNSEVSLSVIFIENDNMWEYGFIFDDKKKEFLYEEFCQIIVDQYNNKRKDIYFRRDIKKDDIYFKDDGLIAPVIKQIVGKKNILLNTMDISTFRYLEEAKKVLTLFANNIVILDMNNIPLAQTIALLKNHSNLQNEIVNFIKNADVDLDDYKYLDNAQLKIAFDLLQEGMRPNEDVINQKLQQSVEDSLRITSVYKGKYVPSLLFDSTGTKKIAALASYIISALKNGHTLIIDELDSSIHFTLTRAIVSMFNNELNNMSQLIFTVHDVSLMDCNKLFRKEQIWFVHKDREEGSCLYSLASFTAEDGVRDTTKLFEKYKKGILGAIPEPNMISTLIQVKNE